MGQFRTNRWFDAIFVAGLLALLGWAYLHRVTVTDWVFFATHQPSAQTERVATAAGLTPAGRRLLLRSNPHFAGAATIQQVCDAERLGCLTSQGEIYVLDDPASPQQTVVTAAHEMLHLAYRRLSDSQKTAIAPDLQAGINQHDADGLHDELAGQTSAADRLDEAHSLLGTEYAKLPAKLETYYQTYFTDRGKVVEAERQAEAVTNQ